MPLRLPLLPERYLTATKIAWAVLSATLAAGLLLKPATFNLFVPWWIVAQLIVFFLFVSRFSADDLRFSVLVLAASAGALMLGVQTGKVFGPIQYTDHLGIKVRETPLLMMIEWLLLLQLSFSIDDRIRGSVYLKTFISAVLVTGIAALLEPAAQRFYWWSWNQPTVPVRNFIAWFILSYFFHFTGRQLRITTNNRIGQFFLLVHVLFFAALAIGVYFMKH